MSIADKIAKERYAQHGEETWSDIASRIARNAAKAEVDELNDEWSANFYDAINSLNFIPGGRILSNIGRPKPYMMNCNVLDVEDSRESIGQLLKDILVVSGTGGGVGNSYSKLRPKGYPIQTNGGFSSGPISFMHCADQVAGTIKTGGGRRAALMSSLSIYHPDIEEFLHVKLNMGKLNNMNISVEIDNKFIQAVKDNTDWDLVWAGKILKTIKARSLWDKIVENALKSGEPGILNLGAIKELSNCEYYNPIVTTNPCQPETSLFLTKKKGIQELKDIKIGDVIWTGKQWSPMANKWSTGVKPVYRYTTSNGYYTECTENHQIVQKSKKIEIKDAECIDKAVGVPTFGGNITDHAQAILAGLVLGDGSKQKNGGKCAYLNIGEKDEDHYSYVKQYITKIIEKNEHKHTLWKLTKDFDSLNLMYAPTPERTISDFWMESSALTMCQFLKGLYSANGSIIESAQRVTYKGTSKKLIQQIQIMLSALGIRSYITTNKPSEIQWDNGLYTNRESYDLNITSDINLFKELIGFTQKYKMDKIKEKKKISPQTSTSIVDIEYIGDMEVFDYTVEADEHTVWQGGLHLSNCGELPLPKNSACCLGSINIANFVKEKNLDKKGYEKAIETAVRFLDNIITINEYALDVIKLNATSDRRVGLGLTGLHYAMLKLGIKYSSPEGVAFTEKVYEILRNHSYWVSTELAKEKGSFTKFNVELYLQSKFIKNLPTKIREKIRADGIRNVCLNTQAPTGTTSLVANVSSGIEPTFAPVYERRYESTDEKGNSVKETKIIADSLLDQYIAEGKDVSHFEGTYDVSPEWHLKIQEAAQRYIDSAVSKTINLPKDYKLSELSELLLKYIPSIKGVTIYKEGSRGDEPLKQLNINEYSKRDKDAEDISKEMDCPTGKCSI